MYPKNSVSLSRLFLLVSLLLFTAMVSFTQGSQEKANSAKEISADVKCGKCNMFPAKFPKWQTQIIFNDDTMAAFDGCKCMFGFLFNMEKFDQEHSSADVAAIWVREFNTGDWIDGKQAQYVIGSDEMGPMGKELIPFADTASAEQFQKEHGGELGQYNSISMSTLQPLMGKMHMKGKMNMKGASMDMGKMNMQ